MTENYSVSGHLNLDDDDRTKILFVGFNYHFRINYYGK